MNLATIERAHFPASLPRLRWFGSIVEPTSGDVSAIFAGACRLMAGERIESSTPKGERVVVAMTATGRTVVTVGDRIRAEYASAFDALVVAYSELDFNDAWADFKGR